MDVLTNVQIFKLIIIRFLGHVDYKCILRSLVPRLSPEDEWGAHTTRLSAYYSYPYNVSHKWDLSSV